MGRKMSPEREREYEDLFAFLDFYQANLHKVRLVQTTSFAAEAARIVETYGKSKALEGLRQAVNDVIEELRDLTQESVAIVDNALRASGVRTLSDVRKSYSASYKKILRRGLIKTETEYYLVNGIVVDMASGATDEERATLQSMLDAFERPH